MTIYQNPRMVELRKQQSREFAELYDKFLRLHPELDGHTEGDDWTREQNLAFREFASAVLKRHKEQQRALVADLGGKLSPLSRYESEYLAR